MHSQLPERPGEDHKKRCAVHSNKPSSVAAGSCSNPPPGVLNVASGDCSLATSCFSWPNMLGCRKAVALKLPGSAAAACTAMDAPQHHPTDAKLVTPLALSAPTTAVTSLLTTPCTLMHDDGSRRAWRGFTALTHHSCMRGVLSLANSHTVRLCCCFAGDSRPSCSPAASP